MEIRKLILENLETLLNTNAQGIQFKIEDPSGIYHSDFSKTRLGDPDRSIPNPNNPSEQINAGEEWYEVITDEFVPVVVRGFNAAFIGHPAIKGFSAGIDFAFLVDYEQQESVIEAVEDFINQLPGRNIDISNTAYNVTYNSDFPTFTLTELINDTRYNQYNLNVAVLALEEAFSANNIKIELQNTNIGPNYVELPILNYTPNRARETTAIQQPNSNSIVSVVRNSAWLASINFYLSLNDDNSTSLRDLSAEILQILEDSTYNQNEIFNLKITYNKLNYIVTKKVLISNVQVSFLRDDLATVTIQVEEAYEYPEVIQPEVIQNA